MLLYYLWYVFKKIHVNIDIKYFNINKCNSYLLLFCGRISVLKDLN